MSEVMNTEENPLVTVPESTSQLSGDLVIRLAQRFAEVRRMLNTPIPPCPPEFARLMTRFVSWEFDGDTLHIHLDDTAGSSLSEKLRRVKRDFYYLAQALLGSPEVTSVVGTSWIIGKNPGLIQKLGFTPLGEIDEAEKAAKFPNENRAIGRAVIQKEDFIRIYYDDAGGEGE